MVDVAILMGVEKETARKEQGQVLEFLLKLAKVTRCVFFYKFLI